jgi:hypothetical protein
LPGGGGIMFRGCRGTKSLVPRCFRRGHCQGGRLRVGGYPAPHRRSIPCGPALRVAEHSAAPGPRGPPLQPATSPAARECGSASLCDRGGPTPWDAQAEAAPSCSVSGNGGNRSGRRCRIRVTESRPSLLHRPTVGLSPGSDSDHTQEPLWTLRLVRVTGGRLLHRPPVWSESERRVPRAACRGTDGLQRPLSVP